MGALACIMLHRRERFILHVGAAGACAALAVLVKQTMLPLLPGLPVAYCVYAWQYRLRGGAFMRGALAGVLAFGAVLGVSALCNPPGQRALASTQEVLLLQQRGIRWFRMPGISCLPCPCSWRCCCNASRCCRAG